MTSISDLREIYINNTNELVQTINTIYDRIEAEGHSPIWIQLIDRQDALTRIKQLIAIEEDDRRKLPLFGIPFAVKDNIDVAGFITSAGCPIYGDQSAKQSAPVVTKLEAAGAILIGKTNMDQFATGLVGTRTPYGICSSVFNSNYISGGSSSGSAVAVASGFVKFALGTDTAGSGRIPAAFNNIIGLKPTRGLLSTRGVIPACRSLDCVSIFAETVNDASIVFQVARGFDEYDPYSRLSYTSFAAAPWAISTKFTFAIPTTETRQFFGDIHNPILFQNAIDKIKSDLGGEPISIDFRLFLSVANLLYHGPWVAERYAAVGKFIIQHEKDIDPIVRVIITKGKDYTAVDAFNAFYELERLKKQIRKLWQNFDVLIVPTAPRCYKIDDIAALPIELNSNLGYYTNFVNLLDLAAISVPAGLRPDGLPFGITLIGPACTDDALLLLGDRIHRLFANNIGKSTISLSNTPKLVLSEHEDIRLNCFLIGVVGAHLSGQPLNYQLTQRQARLVRTYRTRYDYRLYVLKDSKPVKPGLLHDANFKGPGIELEIWALPVESFATFIELIRSPLTIGNIHLADGSTVKGFLVESSAIINAQEITHMGGWRSYLETITVSQ